MRMKELHKQKYSNLQQAKEFPNNRSNKQLELPTKLDLEMQKLKK